MAPPPGLENPALEYGLIAEEVARVFPDLVTYDEEGLPNSVRYHLLTTLLLNELQKQGRLNREQAAELETLRLVSQSN